MEEIEDLSPRTKYPWDKWTDGKAYLLRRGEDYSLPTITMRNMMYVRASRMKIKVITRIKGDTLQIQFVHEENPSPAEQVDELASVNRRRKKIRRKRLI